MENCPEDQFLKMVLKHQGIIKSICVLYYRNTEDRKDAQQDVLVQLWKSFRSFRHESSLSTWIYKVTLNTILARIRQDRRDVLCAPRGEMTDMSGATVSFADDHVQLLKATIDTLGADEKALVILYLEGFNHKEIGDILGYSETNVSTRMHRLREKLRKTFKAAQHEY